MADDVLKPAEAIARLRAARSKQLALLEEIDGELEAVARKIAECETNRDRANSTFESAARKTRAPKGAAKVLAAAAVGGTVSLGVALGPIGLLGLLGVGIGTGIAYGLEAADRKNEETKRQIVDELNEKIRDLSLRRDALMSRRRKLEEKLRLTRLFLDKLRTSDD